MWIVLLILLAFLPLYALIAIYLERKIAAFIQDRLGPMEVGNYGLLQTIADILKLLQKEDIVPSKADKNLFLLAPLIVFTAVFAGFATLPLSPQWMGSQASVGIFYILAVISLDVIGIMMAGWASNNKYALIGAVRAVAQIVSYEIPIGICILSVVVISQSMDLQVMSYQQGIWIDTSANHSRNYLFGLAFTGIEITHIGGFLSWNIFRMPFLTISSVIFFIATLAESNRAPFDIPEAESELIAGFHTEYSGMRWAFFMLGEYAMMLLVSFLTVILFFGSWNTPFPNIYFLKLADWTSPSPDSLIGQLAGLFWLSVKTIFLVFIQMWVRWTYPRLRIDQLMYLCWKVLIPFSILILLICCVWRILG